MRLLLAISGGIDSMYLAENAASLLEGASFTAAHCNFNLRGGESDGDEAFVRQWCSAAGIALLVKHFDTAVYARDHGMSIEMAARQLRYEWFEALCREQGFDGVAVAHNANDNAETMVLNLLRGTGTKGLRGMAAEGMIPVPGATGKLLRPMLGISRPQIEEWMRANGKTWREDSSNASDRHTRNRIRNRLFPIFKEINPAFLEALGRDISNIAEVDDIAEDYLADASAKVVADGGIDLAALRGLKHWKYVLWRLVSPFSLSADTWSRLVSAVESGSTAGGKRFGPLRTTAGRICFPSPQTDARVEISQIPVTEGLETRRSDGVLMMDATAFESAPLVRKWQEGDWMRPLGMRGRKKVSDILTGLKLPPDVKEKALVVEHPDGGGRVAAIAGYRIDDSVKVTDSTQRIIMLKIK